MLTVLHIIGNERHESVRRNIYGETAFFIRHGVDVLFVCAKTEQAQDPFLSALRRLGARVYDRLSLPRLFSGGGLSRALALRELCFMLHIDVIHTHSEQTYRLACAARFLGAPVVHVFTPHTVSALKQHAALFRDRLISSWCDVFVAIDGYTADVLIERLIRVTKIKRVNNGVRQKTGGFTHRNASRANHFTLMMMTDPGFSEDGLSVDAFADLTLRVLRLCANQPAYGMVEVRSPIIRFVLTVSPGYPADYARDLLRRMELDDTVFVIETPEALSCRRSVPNVNAGLCVYYSENRYFSYRAADSIATGIPTLTNDQNLINGSFAASNIEADFDNPDTLAKRVLDLIHDPAARDALWEAEHRVLESQFGADDMFAGIYDIYVSGLRL